jgi:hypothetical protein
MFHEGFSVFHKPAMPDECSIDLAHAKAQGNVHSGSLEEVISRQPAR